jgi:hypothetical protein
MDKAALSPLAEWENFYVIVGSSAGALTGLQFVVMALIAEGQTVGSMLEVRAFGSPNVVHFCSALLISAIVSAPWHSLSSAAVCLAASGLAGVAYGITVIRHARRQTGYAPDAEDWVWYVALPLVAYAVLSIAAIRLASHPASSLFVVAATSLVLLFVGIHNAWDTVTYVAVGRRQRPKDSKEKAG